MMASIEAAYRGNDMKALAEVTFLGEQCWVQNSRYEDNGRIALILVIKDTGEQMAVATVNMPEVELEDDEVLIKDWSENEGILKALVGAKVLSRPTALVPVGFVAAHRCRVIPIFLE